MAMTFRTLGSSIAGTLALLCVSVGVFAADAGSSGRFTVADYLELQSASDPQISPDGTQVVYTRHRVDQMADTIQSAVWIVGADGQHHRFIAKGSGAVWSPDGKSIAYIAEGQPKGQQIFVLHLNVPGPATQLTWGSEPPANLHWSPDGRRIGYTMMVLNPEKWTVDLPKAPDGSHWAATPRFTERMHYRQDRVGFTDQGYRHLFLVDADGGASRQVTTGDWSVGESVYEYIDTVDWAFTPDGRSAIVTGFKEGNPDRNDQDCYIYSVDLETGAAKRLTSTTGGWRRPALSPDGKTIAYVGFPRNGDGYRYSQLYTMGADGSGATLRSAAFDREPQHLVWAPDSSALYFTAEDRGSIHLYAWSAHAGIRQLTEGAEVVEDPSASRGGIVLFRSGPQTPGDLQLINPRTPTTAKQLTHLNDELLRRITLSKVEEIGIDSTGGTHIQGWMVKPPDFDSSRHYPLILEIHGGPYGMYNVAFNPNFQNFAANGYILLYINPRGSTGYGNAFTNSIAKHYPGPDYDDLMAAVDTAIKQGNVDESHMFVSGCSGGGVLSSWVIGHTNRFAAAAVRCPVIDWISMAGETDIPYFTYRFFKKPFWEDPSDWLAESSLMSVGNVKTPTLLMTGELDRRTPIPQTEEFYSALKYRGVPSAMLRFDGEYHGTGRKPSNWMRTQLYMMSWFQRYGANPSGPPPK
jgi:dipeptidyl aminopeptidase/acylaminoacyl peptidase